MTGDPSIEDPNLAERERHPLSIKFCPDCGSSDIRVSRKQGLLILILKKFHMTRYKCRTCSKRFFAGR